MRQLVFVAGMLLGVGRINASVDTLNLWQLPVSLSAGYFQALPVAFLDLVRNQKKPDVFVVPRRRETFNIFRKIKEIEDKFMSPDGRLGFTFQSDSENAGDGFYAGVSLSSLGIGHEIDTKYRVTSAPPGMVLFKGRKKKKFKSGGGREKVTQRASESVSVHTSPFSTEKDKVLMLLLELHSIHNNIKGTHYSYSHKGKLDEFKTIVSELRSNIEGFDDCFSKSDGSVKRVDRFKPEVIRDLIIDRCPKYCQEGLISIVHLQDSLPGIVIDDLSALLNIAAGTSVNEHMPSLRLLLPLMVYFEAFLDQMISGKHYQQLFITDTENTFLLRLSTDGKGRFDVWFFEGCGSIITDRGRVNKDTEFSVLLALMATIKRKRQGHGRFYFLGREHSLDESLSLTMNIQDIVTVCENTAHGEEQYNTSKELEVFTGINLVCEEFWSEVSRGASSASVDSYSAAEEVNASGAPLNRQQRMKYEARLRLLIGQLGRSEKRLTGLSSLKEFVFFKLSHFPVGHLVLVENEGLLEGLVASNGWTEEERAQITRLHLANCGYYTVNETPGLDIDERNAEVINLKAEELRMEMYINLLSQLIQPDSGQGEGESTTGETASACGDGRLAH